MESDVKDCDDLGVEQFKKQSLEIENISKYCERVRTRGKYVINCKIGFSAIGISHLWIRVCQHFSGFRLVSVPRSLDTISNHFSCATI